MNSRTPNSSGSRYATELPVRPPPRPPIDNPPPTPHPRKDKQTNIYTYAENPPHYLSLVPKPFMSGYMEKSSGEYFGKSQFWSRKYVEVANRELVFYDSMAERDPLHSVTIPLDADTYVSLQEKRVLRLENKNGFRLFRPLSELRASAWFYVLSCFCSVAPTAEGYCQKLSNRKKILEERFLKLTTEGILSWYKGEEDSDPRGSIQIRGESISSDSDDPNTVFVNTKNRRFHFQFISQTEAKKWSSVMEWHSQRSKPEHSTMVVRN